MNKLGLNITIVILLGLLSSACAVQVHASGVTKGKDVSRVLGGISVEKGAVVGDLDSVNGGIDLSDDVIANTVDTVNGSIELGNNVSVTAAETVNGRISAGRNLTVTQSLETVNGKIVIGSGSEVGRDLVTVNGNIEINESTVGGDVETYTGDVDLVGSFINGDLSIKKSNSNRWFSWGEDKLPEVIIDKSSVVRGKVHLYRKVNLTVEEGAKVGEVVRHYLKDDS